jgi:hypothetical protein
MNFLNANSTADAAQNGREVVCVGTVAAEAAAANEGDTVSLGGIWD